jgi:hypothetical protein
MCFCVAGAVRKWNGKATEHDISRAVGDHLKPLVEPGVVFTTPPHLQQAGKVGLILFFILRGTKSLLIVQSLGSFVEIKSIKLYLYSTFQTWMQHNGFTGKKLNENKLKYLVHNKQKINN